MERALGARAPALPLIGRSAEIAQISVAVERAAERRGSMLLLAGPAGIGKSRLVRETLTIAAQRGFVTLSGSARVLGQSLAYAPVLEALGPHLMTLQPGRRVRLLDGLPDLGRLFMDLHLPPAVPLGDPALERTRLFEAVARLLARLTEQTPVALVLDDLHWADTATVELLHYLAHGVGDRRILMVGAYRTDEIEVEPALRALVRDVRRAGLAEELPLEGLTAWGVQSLARAMLGGDPPPALVRLLTVRAAGSPLVVTALIGELLAGGGLFRSGGAWALGPGALDTVPAAVRDLVLGYLQRLTADERGLLELVAVAGDAAMPPVLADVLGADEEHVLAGLRRLRDLGLVAEVTKGSGIREPGPIPDSPPTHRDIVHRTTHPAYAEVAYAELPEATRRRLHAAIVVALERRRHHDIELLAPHYRGAGSLLDRRRALAVLVAAAERALAVHAGEEAARDLEAALAHAAGLGQDGQTAGLLERLAGAREAVGHTEAAAQAWSAAVDAYRRSGDPAGVARACRRLALALWDRGSFEHAQEVLSEGFAASMSGVPNAELIGLHETRALLLVRLEDIPAMKAEAEELLALGKRHDWLRALAVSDLTSANLHLYTGAYTKGLQACLRAVDAAERLGDVLLAEAAYRPLATLELAIGRHEQGRTRALQGLGLARSAGIPTLELMPRYLLVIAGFLAGDWDGIWRDTTELLALAHRVGSVRGVAAGLLGRALVLTHRGQLPEAAACLAEARSVFGGASPVDRHLFVTIDAVNVQIALERADPSGALAAAETLATSWPTFAPYHVVVLGEAQVAAGELDLALGTAARVAALGPGAPYPAALAARLVGLVHHRRDDRAGALEALARAAGGFARLAMPFEAARCRLEWALAAAPERPDDATAAAQQGLTVFTGLGARRFADRARRLLRDLGARPAPARRGPGRVVGLSGREVEVVRLVAEGLSNADIARRLVISPRTVTTHLQHVYARLGLPSRAALARYAVENDLIGRGRDT